MSSHSVYRVSTSWRRNRYTVVPFGWWHRWRLRGTLTRVQGAG
jgi:hypothetical protein